jgi:hypothetical protein
LTVYIPEEFCYVTAMYKLVRVNTLFYVI